MPSSRSKNSCNHHNDDHLHHHVHDHGYHDEQDDEHEREHDDERDDDNIVVNTTGNTTGTTSMSSATTIIISGADSGGGGGAMPTPQPSLPPGIKKVVIFDTNAYRTLGRRKVQSLRQRELECGVLALAHPVVMLELSAHLADKNDRDYRPCMSALAALAEHTKKPDASGLCYCPEPRSEMCHQLFRIIPPGNEQRVKDMGVLARYVNKNYPDIASTQMLENFKRCADQVKRLETQWTDWMKRLLVSRDSSVARGWEDALALYTVAVCADVVGLQLKPAEILGKAKVVHDVYTVPLRLMSALLQKLTTSSPPNIDNPKWGNYIWDFLVCFSVGSSHVIDDAKIFLVTGDHDIEEASVAAGCGDRVVSLQNHMKSVGFS